MEIRFSQSTKLDKDAIAVTTSGVMTFPNGIPMWVIYGYLAFAKVKLAGRWRQKGQIPAKWSGDAEELAPGAREVGVREMTPAEIESALLERAMSDPEYRAKLATILADLAE